MIKVSSNGFQVLIDNNCLYINGKKIDQLSNEECSNNIKLTNNILYIGDKKYNLNDYRIAKKKNYLSWAFLSIAIILAIIFLSKT